MPHGERTSIRLQRTLVVTTIVYTVFAGLQWKAINESMEQQQRAYVVLFPLSVDWDQGFVILGYRNIGHTPARYFTLSVTEFRSLRDGPCIFGSQGEQHSRGPTFPDPNLRATLGIVLSDYHRAEHGFDEHEEMMSEREFLTITGWIRYDTGFQKVDQYPFCYWFVPTGWMPCVEPDSPQAPR